MGNISRSEHEPQHFLEADSLCLIEDVLLLFVIFLLQIKFYLRLSGPIVTVNSVLGVNSTFLRDLSVELWMLVEVVGFLQTFLKALETMVGLAMLGLL